MSRRRNALIGLAVVLPAVSLLTWALAASDTSTPGAPPAVLVSGASGTRAAAACRVVAQVQDFVKDDVSSGTVFEYLRVATAELDLAAQQDPKWISLQSGVLSIERGLRNNDASATELGIAIARDQCRRAGVYLPGAVKPQATPSAPST